MQTFSKVQANKYQLFVSTFIFHFLNDNYQPGFGSEDLLIKPLKIKPDKYMATHIGEIIIKAQKQKVFDTLTKPELIKLWQYNKELTTDWKAGSKIKFTTDVEGKILEQWGTVLEVRPNQLIKYNLFTPGPGLEDEIKNYSVTSYVLTSDNG